MEETQFIHIAVTINSVSDLEVVIVLVLGKFQLV
jgi:hypothetical protein